MARAGHPDQILSGWRELAEALIKFHGIHDGHWRAYLKFGATNGFNADMGSGKVLPSAWVPVMGIGITREAEPTALAVDAAEVNPRQPVAHHFAVQ